MFHSAFHEEVVHIKGNSLSAQFLAKLYFQGLWMLGDFCHQISPLAWLGRIEQVLDNDRMEMGSSRSNASGLIWMGSITKGFGEGNLIRQGENPVSIASVTQYRKLHNYSLRRMSQQTNINSEKIGRAHVWTPVTL